MEPEKVSGKRKSEVKFPSKNHYTNNATVRIQRNQAEKQRRDRLNDQIAQLATLVPPAVNASKPLDKVSILRLSASWMRLNYSCLNAKRFKSAVVNYLDMHHSLVSNLDILEKSINGFIIATTFSGVVLMCSRYSEEYIGYQNIDLLGHHVTNFVLPKEKDLLQKKMRNLISKYKNGSSNPRNTVRVRMQQRPLPRSNELRYRKMSFSLSIHSGDETPQTAATLKKSLKIGRHKDFGESAVILIFAEPVQLEPDIDVQYLEQKDCYFTIHGAQGEIIFADHRISIMTGYMPRDVLGNSAYQYIHSSDVPIALFAQKAMFASSDGTGIITYRLRIRDSSYIYLQTKGQIRYKDSTKEVRQFICCNVLLSDDDGSRELKKFQTRYAPQLASSKLKLKDMKLITKSPPKPDGGSPVAKENHSVPSQRENLKQKTNHSKNKGSVADPPMEIEESIIAENLQNSRLYLDLSKINYTGDKNLNHSMSSNSDSSSLSSVGSSPKSSFENGFNGTSQTIQNLRVVLPEAMSCNVPSNGKLSSFDHLSPMQPSNDASAYVEKPTMQQNDCVPVLQSSANSTLLTSDLLLIPDDFTPYDTVSEKSFFPVQRLNGFKDACSQSGMHENIDNFNLSDTIQMVSDNFYPLQDTFQNPEPISTESLMIPDKTNILLENGPGIINSLISQNHFSTCSPETACASDSQSIFNPKVISAANKSIPGNNAIENIDLSFLDHSVENLALLSDLSDLYENSKGLMGADQYQAETAISNSSDTEMNCNHGSSVLYGANVLETDAQFISASHINNNAHSSLPFNDFSPDSYFTSDSDNSMGTNGMQMRTFNADYIQIPVPAAWQSKQAKSYGISTHQKISDDSYSRFQTNAVISHDDNEVYKSSSNGVNHLYSGMNPQSALSSGTQSDCAVINGLVNQPSTSLLSMLRSRGKQI